MGVDKSGSVCLQRTGENLHQEDRHQGKFVSGLVLFFFSINRTPGYFSAEKDYLTERENLRMCDQDMIM